MRNLYLMLALSMIIISCSKKTDDPAPANNGGNGNPVDTTHHNNPIPVYGTLKVYRDNDESFVTGGNIVHFYHKGQEPALLNYLSNHGDQIQACASQFSGPSVTRPDSTYNLLKDSAYVFTYKITSESGVTEMELDIQVKLTAANIAGGCSYMIFNGFAGSQYIETSGLEIKVNKIMMSPLFNQGKFWKTTYESQIPVEVIYPTF